ncbi:MAG: hypothetical protein GXO49_03980 [Chlorobi bacterium]|nr:hypothetical protein [Chlorobiota bacterium]
MQKHVFEIEKLRKVTLYAVLLLLILILALILLLQTSYIQTKITNFVTKELSEKLNSKITISNVKISLFRGFVFKNIYIEDQQKDTLLFVEDLSVIPSGLQLDVNDLSLKEIEINKLFLNLYKVGEDTLNIQYLLDAVNSDNKNKKKNFKIKSQKVSLINSRFYFNISDTIIKNKVNFKNFKADSINLNLNHLELVNDDVISEIENFSFKENSGFSISKLSSKNVHINPKRTYLKSFEVKTPTSNLMFDSLNFDYPANYDFSKYKTKLKSNISIKKQSYFSYEDIQYFLSDTSKYNAQINISGGVLGGYNNFSATNLIIQQKDVFFIKLNSKVNGLNDLKDPSFFIKMNKLEINFLKLEQIHFPYKTLIIKNIPNWLKGFQTITYSGITKGKLSNSITKGKLFGDFGNVTLTAHALKDSTNFYKIDGNISAKELQLSKIIKNKDIGLLSFSQSFNFSLFKNKFKLKTSGRINEFLYKKHLYKDVDLYSEISNNKIDSINILIDQPMLSARILGKLDLSEKVPKVKLLANVVNANVSSLNLINSESDFKDVNFIAEAEFEGFNFNDFLGSIKLNKPLTYIKDTTKYEIENFVLKSDLVDYSQGKKEITLQSSIANFKLTTYKSSDVTIKILEDLKNNILQTYVKNNTKKDTNIIASPIMFEAKILKADIFMSFINPKYKISDDTKIYGFFDPQEEKINISLNSAFFKYKNINIEDFYLMAYTKDNKIYGGVGGSSIRPNKKMLIKNISLEGDYANESINFNLNWDNFKDSANYSANISGKIKIKTKENQKKYYDCSLRNSQMTVNDVLWKFNDANFIIDSTKISIHDLTLTNKKQKIYLDGNISEYKGDVLFAEYENLEIANILPLIKKDIAVSGKLNGNTIFARIYDKPLIFTKDSIVDLNINKIDFGNFYFKSNWDNKENKIHINAYNLKGHYKKFMNDTIYGDYWPTTGNINFVTDVRSMLVKTFKEYYSDYIDFNSLAYIKGKLFVYGNYKRPQVKGNIKLKQASVLIKYLNTNYSIDNIDIYFDDKNIRLSKTKLFSENNGGVAFISGNISHKLFSNFEIDIDVDAKNFQIMKKRRTQTSYFYGTAYGTGHLNFSGPLNNVFLDANLKTEKETYIFIPMSASEALKEEQSFIRFVTDTTLLKKKVIEKEDTYSADLNGFTMNLLIDVTPDATIEIIPDENGDILTNGTGSLILKIDSENNFNMFGTYVISKGKYKINIGSIKKTFLIQNGSEIKWDGDPQNALVDITATYKLNNIKLNNLLPPDETETEKSEVDCFVYLKGTIFDPELKLDIVLPDNVSQKYKSKIASFEEKDINEQFLSLLIMKRFFYDLGAEFADSKPLTGDLLTSSLNSLLKKVSKDFDMTLIYQPGQETVKDEYGLVFSGSAFDDRLTYKGGVGIGGNEIEKKDEAIVGEAEVELKLDKKGNFKAKAYNKANDQLENDGTYTQGLGLVWRQKFDNIFWWKNKSKNDTIQNKKNEK